jgi:hypothetical protein
MNRVVEKFLRAEESIIFLSTDEISLNDVYDDIPIGVRVVVVNNKNGRKRVMDLGLLSFIMKNCENGRYFVERYLDLTRSLDDIQEEFKVFTELEYLALCPDDKIKMLDKDLQSVLQKLKTYLTRRIKKNNEL